MPVPPRRPSRLAAAGGRARSRPRTGVERTTSPSCSARAGGGAPTPLGAGADVAARRPARVPPPSAVGHGAAVRSVEVAGRRVLVFLGRLHLYEGHDPAVVAHGVRVAAAAGCRTVVLTNGAGSLRREWPIGQPVLISDHINLTGRSPLTGRHPPPPFGSRFVDLTDLYSARLRAVARDGRPRPPRGRLPRASRAALRDAGRDPHGRHARRRPRRHVDRARGDRRPPRRDGGARHLAGHQPGRRHQPGAARCRRRDRRRRRRRRRIGALLRGSSSRRDHAR